MDDFKFEIIETLGVISERDNGWQKELNLISWHGKDAKYDIRIWDENHEKMGKGITLTKEELFALKALLSTVK